MHNFSSIPFEQAVKNIEHALSPKKGKLEVNHLQTGYTSLTNSLKVLEMYRDYCRFTATSKYKIAVALLERYKREAYNHGTNRNS